MTPADKQRLLERLADILVTHVEPIFAPGVQVTLLVRMPGDIENEAIVTSDEYHEIRAAIERGLQRAVVQHPGATVQ